jgi:hypothetical protein
MRSDCAPKQPLFKHRVDLARPAVQVEPAHVRSKLNHSLAFHRFHHDFRDVRKDERICDDCDEHRTQAKYDFLPPLWALLSNRWARDHSACPVQAQYVLVVRHVLAVLNLLDVMVVMQPSHMRLAIVFQPTLDPVAQKEVKAPEPMREDTE